MCQSWNSRISPILHDFQPFFWLCSWNVMDRVNTGTVSMLILRQVADSMKSDSSLTAGFSMWFWNFQKWNPCHSQILNVTIAKVEYPQIHKVGIGTISRRGLRYAGSFHRENKRTRALRIKALIARKLCSNDVGDSGWCRWLCTLCQKRERLPLAMTVSTKNRRFQWRSIRFIGWSFEQGKVL